MSDLRPFALVRTGDQWERCSFPGTFLSYDTGVAQLAWTTTTTESAAAAPALGVGLVFDNECRLYHARPPRPGSGWSIERLIWKPTDFLAAVDVAPAVTVINCEDAASFGEFASASKVPPLLEPRGLAVDVNDRLFVAETGRDRILIYDLWSDRLLREVSLPGGRPADLAAHGSSVYAVLTGTRELVRLTACSVPERIDLPPGCTSPSRVAVSPAGRIAILDNAGTPGATVCFGDRTFPAFAEPHATDLEWESDAWLVVARQPGADFVRYAVGPGTRERLLPLRARQYDGLGIVATPHPRRIGYWRIGGGFRIAVPARAIFERRGRVTTFRLDSGAAQTTWGRIFIDACIPEGADVRVHCIALDESDDETPMVRVPPGNRLTSNPPHANLSPPLPPEDAVPDDITQPLHRRESGRELPWTQVERDDRFETYEAPTTDAPGRYLWVTLELRGNTRVTPKVRSIRAEYPSHDYLRRLPRTFSRNAGAAAFLRRYLAMFEGFLGETDARSTDRDLLLDPRSTPDECLPWLASFVGLVLDERWATAPSGHGTTDARREMIRQAAWLFRYRGTVPGLKRFIEIYTGTPVIVLEHFRLRGIGAAVLGGDGSAFASSVVGVGFRVGGAVGEETAAPITGTVEDAFRTHAHRFTVILPSALTEEQLSVVRHIIEIHRPAHTLFDVCTVGAGMRVGRGLLVEVSSVVGRTGSFSLFQIGRAVLGRGDVVGRPAEGGVAS